MSKQGSDQSISINKYISQTGICSRREADKLIEAKRVKLNNIIAKKGNRVFGHDKVTLDGKMLIERKTPVYIKFNKPPGITSTTDKRDKDNIIDYIKYPERIFPIGRLDKASTGLILLTNDGDIVNKILREENQHEKEYIVTVTQKITIQFLKNLSTGVPILGQITKPCKVVKISDYSFRIILTQGLNRQIRRMCEYYHYQVTYLKRVRIMNIKLGKLKPGLYSSLKGEELQLLFKTLKHKN